MAAAARARSRVRIKDGLRRIAAHPPICGFSGMSRRGPSPHPRVLSGPCGETRLGRSDDAVGHGVGDCLTASTDGKLSVEVGEMALDGTGADEEGFGDLGVRESTRQETQHVDFARRKAGKI